MGIEGKKHSTNGAWVLFKRLEQFSFGMFEKHETWNMETMKRMIRIKVKWHLIE